MRQRSTTERVIFHHSLSRDVSVDTITAWHLAKGWAGCGYHYVIRANGDLEHGRELSMVGAHCKWRNTDSVGVCLTGNFFNTEPTVAQIDTARELYVSLCGMYAKHLKVEFHRPEYHKQACPGPKLDRLFFLEHLYRGNK